MFLAWFLLHARSQIHNNYIRNPTLYNIQDIVINNVKNPSAVMFTYVEMKEILTLGETTEKQDSSIYIRIYWILNRYTSKLLTAMNDMRIIQNLC